MRLHAEVAKLDPASLSTRIKFMIETLDSLKNNCMKTDAAASAIHHEHVSRMKQILSSPKFNSSSSGEPLRIGLDDIRNIPKSGRWWLTGASYRDVEPQARKQPSQQERAAGTHVQTDDIDTGVSLHQLAKTQRMNTDARRSIFVAIMSASDYKEACARILKLRLKKSQELEIPKVLIHCAGAEKAFNPYYSLIAMELCADRKLKIAFQFALWDLFKLTGEHPESAYDTQEQEQSLEARSLVNLAKLYGALVADGGLSFSCLKVRPLLRTPEELNLLGFRISTSLTLRSRPRCSLSFSSSRPSFTLRGKAAVIDINGGSWTCSRNYKKRPIFYQVSGFS